MKPWAPSGFIFYTWSVWGMLSDLAQATWSPVGRLNFKDSLGLLIPGPEAAPPPPPAWLIHWEFNYCWQSCCWPSYIGSQIKFPITISRAYLCFAAWPSSLERAVTSSSWKLASGRSNSWLLGLSGSTGCSLWLSVRVKVCMSRCLPFLFLSQKDVSAVFAV